MRVTSTAAVAASREVPGDDGVRRPGGEVHAWLRAGTRRCAGCR
ncbi:hypothetical protein AB0N38_11550 [Micromonospora aurantiaca]